MGGGSEGVRSGELIYWRSQGAELFKLSYKKKHIAKSRGGIIDSGVLLIKGDCIIHIIHNSLFSSLILI